MEDQIRFTERASLVFQWSLCCFDGLKQTQKDTRDYRVYNPCNGRVLQRILRLFTRKPLVRSCAANEVDSKSVFGKSPNRYLARDESYWLDISRMFVAITERKKKDVHGESEKAYSQCPPSLSEESWRRGMWRSDERDEPA